MLRQKRLFSSSKCLSGKLKSVLSNAASGERVSRILDKRQADAARKKQEARIRKKFSSPLTKGTALKVLTDKFSELSIVNKRDVGPTLSISDEALDEVFRDARNNRRLIYTILGTSGDQLKDSVTVEKDVLKFLARNDITKAIYLSRLAKSRGEVAMNHIIQHLLREQHGSKAVDLFQNRKKWGVPINSHTLTILFHGSAHLQNGMSEKHIQKLYRIFRTELDKDIISIVHVNACLSALLNSTSFPATGIKFFEDLCEKQFGNIIPSKQTYTIFFNGLARHHRLATRESAESVARKALDAWYDNVQVHLKEHNTDESLVRSFVQCFVKSNVSAHVEKGVFIMRKWFDICPDSETEKTIEVSPITVKKLESQLQKQKAQQDDTATLDNWLDEELSSDLKDSVERDLSSVNFLENRFPLSLPTVGLYTDALCKLSQTTALVRFVDSKVLSLGHMRFADGQVINQYMSAKSKLLLKKLLGYQKAKSVNNQLVEDFRKFITGENPVVSSLESVLKAGGSLNGPTFHVVFNALDNEILLSQKIVDETFKDFEVCISEQLVQLVVRYSSVIKQFQKSLTINQSVDFFELMSRIKEPTATGVEMAMSQFAESKSTTDERVFLLNNAFLKFLAKASPQLRLELERNPQNSTEHARLTQLFAHVNRMKSLMTQIVKVSRRKDEPVLSEGESSSKKDSKGEVQKLNRELDESFIASSKFVRSNSSSAAQ